MEPLGTPKLITLHWTAGDHRRTFPDYHYCVRGDGSIVATLDLTLKGAHTWGRNTGNVGVSMCAMAKGYPPTKVQVEATAKLVAEICLRKAIAPYGTITLPELRLVGQQLQPTGRTISAPTIADHAWFARRDGYFPNRWDVGEHFVPIVAKARWYYAKLKAGAIPFETLR